MPTALLFATLFAAPPADEPLSPEAKQYLEQMVKDFLFDPRDAQRVRVTVAVRYQGGMQTTEREGWLVAAKGDNPARIFFTDGDHVLAPPEKDIKKVDFVADCRRSFAPVDKDGAERTDEAFNRLGRHEAAVNRSGYDLVRAAWLHRLGEDELAARALTRAFQTKDALVLLRRALADQAYESMLASYNARADDEALRHADRMLRQYATEALPGGQRIVDDLRRRQKEGTFNKKPLKDWPREFDSWDGQRQATFLIDALAEMDGVQAWTHRFDRGGMVGHQPVRSLVAVGDAAVPALIDALEKDNRLTRRMRDLHAGFGSLRREQPRENFKVVTVRQAALETLLSILRLHGFRAATDDNLELERAESAGAAAELRAYWKKYGSLPFDERMVKMLGDANLPFELTREAARNLVGPGIKPNPVVAKFRSPTVAEALLKAMDRDLEDHDAGGQNVNGRVYVEDTYLDALVELGDRRIAGLLGLRGLAAPDVHMRRQWTFAALRLGEVRPWQTYCDEVRTGTKPMPDEELLDTVRCLIGARTSASDRALFALAAPDHPFAKQVVLFVLERGAFRYKFDSSDLRHPFMVHVLRQQLHDLAETGSHWKVANNYLERRDDNSSMGQSLPDYLKDPAVRLDEVHEKVRDMAACRLSDVVFGMPRYHPLLLDGDRILNDVKRWFACSPGSYRVMNEAECQVLQLPRYGSGSLFVPDFKLLARPATAADVTAGRALFQLDGKGKVTELKLPASAVLKGAAAAKNPGRVLIVQAETADGVTTYGVIARHALLVVTAEELDDVQPVVEQKAEK